jgi:outer membrane protein OmpA-like peptidoglycan-associated protein
MKKQIQIFLLLFIGVGFSQEKVMFYFDNNKAELNKKELTKLNNWILVNKTSKILSITGSTDEVGTNGFNDTLSNKRVNYIFEKVKNLVKIRADFKSISLGEKGATSKIKAENRKAIITFLQEKDLAKENEVLGIKPAVVTNEKPTIVPIEEKDMNFPENATLLDKVALSKPGTIIEIKDIYFYQSTFRIMPTSDRALNELLLILDKNPTLKIEIQGHICCVDKDARNLSLERAKQVRRFLVSNEINQNRITVKGFGVAKPKFPIPEENEIQASANRRVEIMILSK